MQFLINGYDYTDDQALDRRMAARDAHMTGVEAMYKSGNFLFAGAMLNEEGQMCGSTIFAQFESRTDVDAWLKEEAYVKGKVWDRIEVIACKIPPMFLESK